MVFIFFFFKICFYLYVKGIGWLKLFILVFIKIYKIIVIIWVIIKFNIIKEYWKIYIIYIIVCMYINVSIGINLMMYSVDIIIN